MSVTTNLEAYQQLDREQFQVAQEASEITTSTNRAFEEAILKFEMATESMKKKYNKEISDRDCTIKILALSLLAVAACAIFLGTKLVLIKC